MSTIVKKVTNGHDEYNCEESDNWSRMSTIVTKVTNGHDEYNCEESDKRSR